MVKKKTSKKTVKKKASTKKSTRKVATGKSASKKTAKKKTTKKKTTKKKTAKKKSTSKKTTRKKTAKKSTAKKKSGKKTVKKTAKKKTGRKKTTKKKTTKRTTKKKEGARKKTTAKTSAKRSSPVGGPSVRDRQFEEESERSEVEKRKFVLSPDEFGARVNESTPPAESPGLPPRELESNFDETMLVLLVRDPEWIFVYWEIDEATRERFLIPRSGHSGRLMIRYYDVTDCMDSRIENASRIFDVEVNDMTSSWYQHLPEPNRQWIAEIGVISEEGDLLVICRSNCVHTPRASMAPVSRREKWLRTGDKFREWRFIETPGGISPERAGKMGMAMEKPKPDTVKYVLTTEGEVRPLAAGEQIGKATPLTTAQAEAIMRSRIGASEEIWRLNLQALQGRGGVSSEGMLPSSHDMPGSGGFVSPENRPEREDK